MKKKMLTILLILIGVIVLATTSPSAFAAQNTLTIKKLPIEKHASESVPYIQDTVYRVYFIQEGSIGSQEKRQLFDKLKLLTREKLDKSYAMVGRTQPTDANGMTEITLEKDGTYLLLEDGDRGVSVDGHCYHSSPMLIAMNGRQRVEVKPLDKTPQESENSAESSEIPAESSDFPVESSISDPLSNDPDGSQHQPNRPSSPSPSMGDIGVGIALILFMLSLFALFSLRTRMGKSKAKNEENR